MLQTDSVKLRQHYINTTTFYIDLLCLLPLDFLYLSLDFQSMLRLCRLVKIYRFWEWLDRTERHTNYPNLFRLVSLMHYLLVAFHWNACIFYAIHKGTGFGSGNNTLFGQEYPDLAREFRLVFSPSQVLLSPASGNYSGHNPVPVLLLDTN